jgi:hypothetical protein
VRPESGPAGIVNCVPAAPIPPLRVCLYLERVTHTYRTATVESRREYFRLPYPISTGALLKVGDANYKVDEISERGLRVVTGVGRFPLNSRVQGVLMLTAGLRCMVSGTVLRVDDNSFVVLLDKGPTCYDVIREQRHVARNFPDWKPHSG